MFDQAPTNEQPSIRPEPAARRLVFDADAYRAEIAELGLGRAEETALLEALWGAMRSFVDLGWSLDVTPSVKADFTKALEIAMLEQEDA